MRLIADHRRLSTPLVAVGAVVLLALPLFDRSGGLMAALPVALLALAIASRRYPGERLLLRLVRRPRRRPVRAVDATAPRPPATLGLRDLALLATVRPLRGPPLLPRL